jgi:hypothetical protein
VHELEVIALDEPRTVSTPGELAEVIGSRINGGNHFEIASPTSAFPMLDVMVRDQHAVVHFFLLEGVAGDQAVSNLVDPPDEVKFPHSAFGETISMPGSVLVDEATAVACVMEFAETLARPTLVDWIEL